MLKRNNTRAFSPLRFYHFVKLPFTSTMTKTTTKVNDWYDRPSNNTQDADWVIISEDGDLSKDGFELIDAAEAQCWCGGSDTESCRQRGHSWPLCDIDQDDLWPEQLDEIGQQQHEEKDKPTSTTNPRGESSSEKSNSDDSKEATKKPNPRNAAQPPGLYESGPFATLAVLTELLENGKFPRV